MDIGLEPTHCEGLIAAFTAMPLNTFGNPAVGFTRLSSTCEILHILVQVHLTRVLNVPASSTRFRVK